GKLIDRAHVVEMRMRDHDVGDILGPDPQFLKHPQRRYPIRDIELARHLAAAALLHEPAIAENDAVAIAGEDKAARIVYGSLVERAPHEARHRLLVAPRIFDDEDFPITRLSHVLAFDHRQRSSA